MGIQSILSFLRLRGTYSPCLFLISAANDAVASDHSLSHNKASASPAAQSGRMNGVRFAQARQKREGVYVSYHALRNSCRRKYMRDKSEHMIYNETVQIHRHIEIFYNQKGQRKHGALWQ
jgi:hypothetical protein